MPVEKSQQITLVDYPEVGINTNLNPDTKLEGKTTLRVACDSQTCTKSVSWVLETAGDTAANVPDDAFRIMILEHFTGQKNVFCSSDCLRRWLKNYVTPLSPREQAEIDTHNASIAEPGQGVVAAMVDPLSQPDGYAEESANV